MFSMRGRTISNAEVSPPHPLSLAVSLRLTGGMCDENRYIAQLHLVAHSVCTLCVATAHAGQKWELPPVNPLDDFL